ncbi:MAG: proline iminopeptidase-family hydrolase [Bernardetiaceae bacterium]
MKLLALSVFLGACQSSPKQEITDAATPPPSADKDGVQMIALKEGYQVWTKKTGDNPAIKVLLLHGGPALTHEYMKAVDPFFAEVGIEFYHYDQLGSHHSDQPENDSLWTIERFVEEVEQVRQALGLDADNFYLMGNSWGGLLAMEYALKYQQHLKGLIICNMTADFDRYAAYNAKLRSQLPDTLLARFEVYEKAGQFGDSTYQALVFEHYYKKHILRSDVWPEEVMQSFAHINQHVYAYMQGPSEFVPGGILAGWSVWDRLPEIRIPTLTVGAKYDTMNPEEMEQMSQLVQNGSYLYCPNGSHLAMWDDQEAFMSGVVGFIQQVNSNKGQ